MIDYEILMRGSRFEIRAIRRLQDDKSLVRQYIATLDRRHQAKLAKDIATLADHGTSGNPTKYRKLKGHGNLHELKEKPYRLLFFFSGRGVAVFTHGFIKRDDNTPQTEIDRAVRLRTDYFDTFGEADA